jgi:hypothetical protein
MRQKSNSHELSSERIVKGIRLGDASVTPPKKDPHRAGRPSRRALDRRALPPRTHCRGLYYSGSKKFLEAGKRRLAGDKPAPPPATRLRISGATPGS